MDFECLECELEVIELDAPDTDLVTEEDDTVTEIYLTWFTDWRKRHGLTSTTTA